MEQIDLPKLKYYTKYRYISVKFERITQTAELILNFAFLFVALYLYIT